MGGERDLLGRCCERVCLRALTPSNRILTFALDFPVCQQQQQQQQHGARNNANSVHLSTPEFLQIAIRVRVCLSSFQRYGSSTSISNNMVGLSLVGGKSSKLRNLVAVLLVCNSVVSHSSAGMLRELVGDTTGPTFTSGDSVVTTASQPGVEAESVAMTPAPAPTPSPADSVDPNSPTPEPSTTDAATTSTPMPSTADANIPAPLTESIVGTTATTDLTPSPFLQNAALFGGASSSSSPTETGTEVAGSTPNDVSSFKTTLTKTTSKLTTSVGSGSSSSDSSASTSVTATSSSSSLSSSASGSFSSATTKRKDESGSGSDDVGNYESGSGSTKTYACGCKSLFKVSLMGQSDYCLAKNAKILNKCGNVGAAESGECPRRGAMPCADTGHVLANDSICALDDRDGVYKCVASREDLEIMQNGGKKKKKKSNLTSSSGAGAIVKSDTASLHRSSPAFQAVTLIISVALGIAALV